MIIDHVERVEVLEHECHNELQTLETLFRGLRALYDATAACERSVRDATGGGRVLAFGVGLPGIDDETALTLPCFFHWFGTTVINYARLVGFLHGLATNEYERADLAARERVTRYCDTYVSTVPELEPVLYWRNKVFAHFAITAPHRLDSGGLLDVSTMHPVGLSDGRLRLGDMIATVQGADVEMPRWSLTDVFEALSPRYWPGDSA